MLLCMRICLIWVSERALWRLERRRPFHARCHFMADLYRVKVGPDRAENLIFFGG
jgi:hypothetical protein